MDEKTFFQNGIRRKSLSECTSHKHIREEKPRAMADGAQQKVENKIKAMNEAKEGEVGEGDERGEREADKRNGETR